MKKPRILGEIIYWDLKEGEYYFVFDRDYDGDYPVNLRLVKLIKLFKMGTMWGSHLTDVAVVFMDSLIDKQEKIRVGGDDNSGFYSANAAEIRDEKVRVKQLVHDSIMRRKGWPAQFLGGLTKAFKYIEDF